MNTFIKTTLLSLILGFSTVYAGSGHSHNHSHASHTVISKKEVKKHAYQELKKLVQAKRLAPSWLKALFLKMQQKEFQHNKEWVVSYKNEAITDKKKQLLYIFVSLEGVIMGANYTGK